MKNTSSSVLESTLDFIERKRAEALRRLREGKSSETEGDINDRFDEYARSERRKAIGKGIIRSAAKRFRDRREQTAKYERAEIRNQKRWEKEILEEERRREKASVSREAKKELQRLRRNAKAREKYRAENLRIASGKWKGKKKLGKIQLKLGDKLKRIWELNETCLPPKEKFYSSLSESHITDEEYERAQYVWKLFGMKTMRDYHDVYLKTDVLLLADVMDDFRKNSSKDYKPLWYYTSPSLTWDACLKKTGIVLDCISDPTMYNFFEESCRGGISTVLKRFAVADNKYIGISKIPESVIRWLKDLNVTFQNNPKYWEKIMDAFERKLEILLRNYSDEDVPE
ncbi:Hypothetical predicted protein [Paramuricea clavata]|uniref:Uncharacterized protein n=1 Tax=Paramuricea clavata TaxID=317549 RepID=A0A7D9JP29_PARCT|nr:Hypothetical predicted protein [Paramuricea clavata]